MEWIVWKELRGKWVNVGCTYGDCKTVAIARARIFGCGIIVQSRLSYEADGGLYEKLCRQAHEEAVLERRAVPRTAPFIDRRSASRNTPTMPREASVKRW